MHSLPCRVTLEGQFSKGKAESGRWDLESCVLGRNVAAAASLHCTNLPRGQRAIPGKADRHGVNSQPIYCSFLSLQASSKTPHSPSFSFALPPQQGYPKEGTACQAPQVPKILALVDPNEKPSARPAGDYFGILMEAKVTSFPFSVLDNPMYWGSTAVYLGWSLM